MEFSTRDLFISVIFHAVLLFAITVLNPFKVVLKPDFESVGVNIIEMPPLGEPELIQPDEMPDGGCFLILRQEETYPFRGRIR